MKPFSCTCGNLLFFNSTQCVQCGSQVGMCPGCWSVVSAVAGNDGKLRCPHQNCGLQLALCHNYTVESVCNQYIDTSQTAPTGLCAYCAMTKVIPDLTIAGNHDRWRDLEAAKRRVLYTVRELGYPLTPGNTGVVLSFGFEADGATEVHTGHADGRITINIREADAVEREMARVQFDEPQRTLVGHFRHELGHYIWQRLVKGRDEVRFRSLFGDERSPCYDEALRKHHTQGPLENWQGDFISAYATMHPWEDFAETFGAYLDMVSVIHTAERFGLLASDPSTLKEMLDEYSRIGLIANEWNRDMGLLDLVPEIFSPKVVEKMAYVDALRSF
jgi:hypothetical protein